jgi:hypothetical protein
MRNNGSKGDGREHCMPVTKPVRTLTTTGHQSLVTWDLLPYYSHGHAQPSSHPLVSGANDEITLPIARPLVVRASGRSPNPWTATDADQPDRITG